MASASLGPLTTLPSSSTDDTITLIIPTPPPSQSPSPFSPPPTVTSTAPARSLDPISDGQSLAGAITYRWLHPSPTLRVTVDPPNPSDESQPLKAAHHTENDGAYVGFLSNQPITSAKAAIPPSIFTTSTPWFLQWPMFFLGYTADAHVQKATALMYLVLCIIGIVWRNEGWYWWVLAGMTADAGFRVIGGDRLAVFSTLAEMVTTFIPGTYPIASAPRQFAWMIYTALTLAAILVSGYVISGDSDHVALATLLGVLGLFQLLEMFGVSVPGLLFERGLVRWGLISDGYRHKAEATISQLHLKMASGKAKMQYSAAQHAVVVTSVETGARLLQFDALTLAARTKFDPLKNCRSITVVHPHAAAPHTQSLIHSLLAAVVCSVVQYRVLLPPSWYCGSRLSLLLHHPVRWRQQMGVDDVGRLPRCPLPLILAPPDLPLFLLPRTGHPRAEAPPPALLLPPRTGNPPPVHRLHDRRQSVVL